MKKSTASHRICLISVAIALTSSLRAQADSPLAVLGLPRLKTSVRANAASSLSPTKFNAENLSGRIAPGETWSRPLRGGGVSVSFLILGSRSTVVEIGGARLGLTGSLADGTLQLMFDDARAASPEWRSLGVYLPLDNYAGQSLGALTVITVQIAADRKSWHVYSGTKLLAYNLPLIAGADRTFTLKAGVEGAWLCGLVQADENPLYDDANNNGIDDAFEKQHGGLLLTTASTDERENLARRWMAAQRTTQPSVALSFHRPIPDHR